ncbi:hypothetical protein MM213_20280 [Belliella sp. R4-6]|uniref:Lipocalin-like domain-containing protein n=1 Tax=Belliella alkalica TaxID=1730871 RepID=A0ABS9VHC8_9BACT|nr:hypothetical protein [Belliella alkalica]
MTIISFSVRGQDSTFGLIGVYESTQNKFERYSILILEKDKKFIYKYGVGGCQGEVKGTWTIQDKRLEFLNDQEFLNNDIINYPNLALTTWTIKKKGIKPDKLVNSGCVKDNKLHVKNK